MRVCSPSRGREGLVIRRVVADDCLSQVVTEGLDCLDHPARIVVTGQDLSAVGAPGDVLAGIPGQLLDGNRERFVDTAACPSGCSRGTKRKRAGRFSRLDRCGGDVKGRRASDHMIDRATELEHIGGPGERRRASGVNFRHVTGESPGRGGILPRPVVAVRSCCRLQIISYSVFRSILGPRSTRKEQTMRRGFRWETTAMRFATSLLFVVACSVSARADEPLRIIVFGAHPDDCELDAGGTAARWAKLGHKVKFVSVTNGDIGHHEMAGAILARRRTAEVEALRRDPGDHDRGPRHPRRRADADPGEPPHHHQEDPRVEGRRRDRPPSQRLPPRPPVHGHPGPGCGLHGHRPQLLPRRPRAPQ